ncbi:glycosyltransferase family 9 protein [Paraburkholderia adhaesiva]|uniref:glycosyltransferase family 9 protein n=1 Tax=Paraburkholderia adhaesiva TaxID=2883244 RepID=UPI001F239C11|nr:glycosyltransferase family 9 protein [Paraburkholderia adhaesiva]
MKLKSFVNKILSVPDPWIFQQPIAQHNRAWFKIMKSQIHKIFTMTRARQMRIYHELDEIPRFASGSRVLLVYDGIVHIGDALMDLAGRALLEGHSVKMDVVLDPALLPVFESDPWFSRIYTDISQVQAEDYAFVILNTLNRRVIKKKAHSSLRDLPFTSLVGWFIDRRFYNKIQFSYYSWSRILGLSRSNAELQAEARVVMGSPIARAGLSQIVIAIGGKEADRTYLRWSEVLRLVDQDKKLSQYQYALIGSRNGLSEAQSLLSHKFENINLISYVNTLTLHQTREVVGNSILFMGADGGLMHVTHTTSTPTLALFSGEVDPRARYIDNQHFNCKFIRSAGDVSEIDPTTVARELALALDAKKV